MAYTKNNWAIYNPELPDDQQDDAFITLAKLQNIESGIEEAHKLAEESVAGTPGKDGADGKDGQDGKDGADGYTPVKGTDYFTEEDKKEIVDAVLATQKNEPYFDEELNKFFACGVHVNVYAAEEAGKLKITWLTNGAGNELIVPENIYIFGGCASEDKVAYYPATSIAVYSGNIDTVLGGCFGNGLVGNATVIINGGKFDYVCGGGMHWAVKNAHHNHVGHADIVINDAENIACVCGGTASGVCSTGSNKITVNGGTIGVLMAGGTNGYTGNGEIVMNGGTVRSAQAGNRGTLGNIKITVNDGTITNAVYSGVGDTATFVKSELHILGGSVNKVAPGKYAGVEDTAAERVSGTYREGIIADENAASLHLVKVMTIEDLHKKLVDAGVLVETV